MFLFAVVYSAVLCIFSNFITVLGIRISYSFSLAESVAESLFSESRFYNHMFRHLIPRDVTRPIIHLDVLQSGQCFAVIDCMASRMIFLSLLSGRRDTKTGSCGWVLHSSSSSSSNMPADH